MLHQMMVNRTTEVPRQKIFNYSFCYFKLFSLLCGNISLLFSTKSEDMTLF